MEDNCKTWSINEKSNGLGKRERNLSHVYVGAKWLTRKQISMNNKPGFENLTDFPNPPLSLWGWSAGRWSSLWPQYGRKTVSTTCAQWPGSCGTMSTPCRQWSHCRQNASDCRSSRCRQVWPEIRGRTVSEVCRARPACGRRHGPKSCRGGFRWTRTDRSGFASPRIRGVCFTSK